MALKDHPETSAAGKAAKADAEKADTVSAQVQEQLDREEEQGFRGVEVDPTPNEHYTVAGVTAGKPTPETDPESAEKARRAALGVEWRAETGGEKK